MDEAFVPLHAMVQGLTAGAELRSEDAGVHMVIERYAIETPIELDIAVGEGGLVEIGSVPPLYRVSTSLRPSYHQIRFTAELSDPDDHG